MAKKELKKEPIDKKLWKAADKLRKNIDATIDIEVITIGNIIIQFYLRRAS